MASETAFKATFCIFCAVIGICQPIVFGSGIGTQNRSFTAGN